MSVTYGVKELNRKVKTWLEGTYPDVRVRGEISNLHEAQSGHRYFTLKDEHAGLRCAWFRNRRSRPQLRGAALQRPADGMEVVATGMLSLYEERGEYQLIVERLEESGAGALQRKFQALQRALASEGLFEERRKQPLPPYPRTIGVITSPDGAAMHDIRHTLERRNPAVAVLIYETTVQGDAAAAGVARCIERADTEGRCDLLIVARGGGSPEDLQAFNEELVARAIFHCRTPLVTGIGHETDCTIADMAADRRAATPTAAAELSSCERSEQLRQLYAWQRRARDALRARLHDAARAQTERQRGMRRLVSGLLHDATQAVDWRRRRLPDPAHKIREDWRRFRDLHRALGLVARERSGRRRLAVERARNAISARSPLPWIRHARQAQQATRARLERGRESAHELQRQHLDGLRRRLAALAPTAVLQRGYAIVEDGASGRPLADAALVKPGDTVRARLARGALWCTVNDREGG